MDRKKIVGRVNRIYGKFWNICLALVYDRQYRTLYKNSGKGYKASKQEINEYKKKWSVLQKKVNPIYYKLFSNYVRPDVNFLPEDITHNVIESLLNPPRHRIYYEDKNMFDKILEDLPDACPKTLLRRIDKFYYTSLYQPIYDVDNSSLESYLNGYVRIVVKETLDSCSGQGVRFFQLDNGLWKDCNNGALLTVSYLNEIMGDNYIIQEALEQAEFMKSFNSSSVNTFRLLTYRSISDNKVHVLNAILRIGKKGSLVDNAHQGGGVIGVSLEGHLNHFLTDQYGLRHTEFNGIDFSKQDFVIPCWDIIKEFASQLAERVLYNRIINLDIMLDESMKPRLIEYNLRGMSIWLYQFNNCACFREYTDEIIDYCCQHKHEIRSEYLML